MSAGICTRCAEPFAKASTEALCRFCSGEIRHNAVDALRILGHSKEEVVHARARAFDGHSVDQILSGLCGDERVGVVA
jgi:hypothetical protein